MTESDVIKSAKTIAEYCKSHICTDCPLNIGKRNEGIMKAHCVCDYNIIHLPSTWKIDELKEKN